MMGERTRTVLAVAALVLAVLAVAIAVVWGPGETPVEMGSYSCDVYTEQGCAKFVVASGGEIEVQSGGTLDIQSGATTDFSGGVDLDGAALVLDADGDTSIQESSDDVISVTLGAATGDFAIYTGNLVVGDGTAGETHNGEDLYVEGIVEVDGAAYFDGAVDMDSTLDVAGAVTFQSDLIVDDTLNVDDTSYALTGTQTLTPTASMYVISSGSAVTITLATAGAAAGDLLWLVDNTAQAVVIVDTTATAGGANRTLGNHDVIGFIFDGTIWVEAFYSDNS